MQTINPSFVLDAKDVDYYNEAGFVVLRNYLSQDMVLYLREKVREQLKVPTDNYQKGFSRLGYDLCDGDANIYSLLREPAFRTMMSQMSGGKRLFFTQGVGFEMKKKHSKGFEWHIESQSFGFHRTEDYATTIWIPLHRIDTKAQRGGMRYVPKNIISGEYMYSHVDPAVFRCMEELIAGDGISFDDYKALRDGPLNSSGMNTLLEYFAVEDDYELGDILLIDKYVIHRSVMLDEGELESRDAFSLRFICETSRYDYHRAHMIEIPRNYYGYQGPTKFHLDICKQDGELIVDSPFFHDRESRYVVA